MTDCILITHNFRREEALAASVWSQTQKDNLVDRLAETLTSDQIAEGYYALIEAQVQAYLDGRQASHGLYRVLESRYYQIQAMLENYRNTYSTPGEWTLEAVVADELLIEGLEMWKDGLKTLLRNVDALENGDDAPGMEDGLELLFEGNARLLITEKLSVVVGVTGKAA